MQQPPDEDLELVESSTRKLVFGCGNVYRILDQYHGRPLRVFMKKGHTGLCVQALFEALGRLLTIIIQQTDVPLARVERTLKGITCEGGVYGRLSCIDALAREFGEMFPRRIELTTRDYEPCAPTD